MGTTYNQNIEKTALTAGVWYITCNICFKGITMLTAPVFNRLLSQEEVGNFSNIQSWAGIFFVVFTLELSSSVNIAKFDYTEHEYDSYLASLVVLGSIITTIFLASYVTFQDVWDNYVGIGKEYMYALFIYMYFSPAANIFLEKLRSVLHYKQIIVLTAIMSFSTLILSLALVFAMDNRLSGRVIGSYVPTAIVGLILYGSLLFKGKKIKASHWKYALAISLPMAFHLLAGTILSSADRIMITRICGADDNALYSVAYLIAGVVILLWTSINAAWAPWCYIKFNDESNEYVKKYSKFLLVCAGIVVFSLVLLAPEMLYILGGSTYIIAASVVPPILCGCYAMIIYTLYVNVEQFYKKQVFVALGTMLAGAINIGLNYIFIPMFGYVAAAYTTWAGYFILFVFHYLITKYIIKKDNIYDIYFILNVLIVGSVMISCCSLLYKYNIFRYCIICILLILLLRQILLNWTELSLSIKNKSLEDLLLSSTKGLIRKT